MGSQGVSSPTSDLPDASQQLQQPDASISTDGQHPPPPRLTSPSASSPVIPTTASMTTSSTPLGNVTAARNPPALQRGGSNLTSDLQKRMQAFRLGRQGAPAGSAAAAARGGNPALNTSFGGPAAGAANTGSPVTPGGITTSPVPPSPSTPLAGPGGVPANFTLPNGKPMMPSFASSPTVPNLRMGGPKKPSLAEKRGLGLSGGMSLAAAQKSVSGPGGVSGPGAPAGRKKPVMTLSQMGGGGASANGGNGSNAPDETKPTGGTMMDKYAEYLDAQTGTLRFKGKAVLSSTGVDFSSGSSFSISLDEVDTLDELGKGNYGTVYKVRHSRPRMRVPGLGLAGNKFASSGAAAAAGTATTTTGRKSFESMEDSSPVSAKSAATTTASGGTSGIVMAMKEIRLELDDAKFAAIIMELDILHRCISPYIIDFYGAFFQEGAVYICIEFMDGGSIDKIYGGGIPESVLRKITFATTMGLKCLKDEHNIIHRDVKPTNILMNTRGQIKICDFGVSGNLVASIAKTNIGCQSYMAPERISTGNVGLGANPAGGGTYSVQSDIWSLGLSIIECAMGRYPYPPETYNNIFSQLSAIVDGEPPDLPTGYSEAAHNFVRGCLNKIPNLRPTYAMLLQHAWLAPLAKPAAIEEEDEEAAEAGGDLQAPSSAGAEATTSTTTEGLPENVLDKEVALWVLGALDRRRRGKLGKSEKPALHAAPLDVVTSPVADKVEGEVFVPGVDGSGAGETTGGGGLNGVGVSVLDHAFGR